MRGRQVPIDKINGGMISDIDPRKIPNKSFQKLINTEYDENGYLIKINGYNLIDLSIEGEVLDIKKVSNHGYLIAANKLQFVSDLVPNPLVNVQFSECRSALFEDGKDQFFYVSYSSSTGLNEIRKWYYTAAGGKDLEAGIANITVGPYMVSDSSITPFEYWHCNIFDSGNDDSSLTFTSCPVVRTYYLSLIIGPKHYTLKSNEKIDKILIPVKDCTIVTASQKLTCKVNYLDSDGNATTLASGESAVITTGDDYITITLDTSVSLPNSTYSLEILFYFSVASAGSADSITFYRAVPWLLDDEDTTGRCWISLVEYSDREPELAFRVSNATLSTGNYKYSVIVEDINGVKSVPTSIKSLIWPYAQWYNSFRYSHSWGLPDGNAEEKTEFATLYSSNPNLSSMIFCGTLVNGSTFYEIAKWSKATIDKYSDGNHKTVSAHFSGASSPITDYGLIPPCYIIVTTDSGGSIEVDEDYTNPTSINPLSNSLFEFRDSLWCIARITDSAGVRRNFIRRSDINSFDRWNSLDEVALPEDPIECQPLREDMTLAFTRENKAYRIDPSGSDYTWLKISDTGLIGNSYPSESDTVQASPRVSCVLRENIFWVNKFGLNRFDGASINLEESTLRIISWIKKFISNNGVMFSSDDFMRVHLSATFEGNNYSLVFDILTKTIYLHSRERRITCMPSLIGYIGLDSGIGTISEGWSEEGVPITTTIVSKKFASSKVDRIRLYYFEISYRIQVEGSLSVEFEFSTGKTVTKTIDISGTKIGDVRSSKVEAYGEGEWFQFTITHNTDGNFEILSYALGALPIDLSFTEVDLNA